MLCPWCQQSGSLFFYVQVLFHFFLASTMKKETLSTFPFRLVSYALDDQEWEEKVSSEWFSWDCTTDTWEVQWLPSSLAHLLMISMTLWTMIWDKNKTIMTKNCPIQIEPWKCKKHTCFTRIWNSMFLCPCSPQIILISNRELQKGSNTWVREGEDFLVSTRWISKFVALSKNL